MRVPAVAFLLCVMVAASFWLAAIVDVPGASQGEVSIESPVAGEPSAVDSRSSPLSWDRSAAKVASVTGASPSATPRPTVLRVLGSVFRQDGKVASRASVSLGGSTAHTDACGRFVLCCTVWPDDAAPLIVWETGFEPVIRPRFATSLPSGGATTEIGPLQLQLGARLGAVEGVVVDATGTPQKGWRLSVQRDDPIDANLPVRCSIDALVAGAGAVAHTGKDGRFALPAVRAGDCRLVAQRGRRRVETPLEVPPTGLSGLRVVID